jgi:pimeloyl-ACP methyl ester carboxylesterase
MEQPIWIESGERLPGIANLPDAPAAETGVVFVHGWAGYRTAPHRMFVTTAAALAERGIASVRFDLRGRGASLSDGSQADLDGMIDDTLCAAKWLRDRHGVGRVYVLGICSGGNVALGAASLDKTLAGLILWSTPLFAPFKTKRQAAGRRKLLLLEYLRKLLRRETYLKLIKGRLNLGLIGRILFGRAQQPSVAGRNPKDSLRDIILELDGFHNPALFIYGSNDDEAVGAPQFYDQCCREHGIPAAFHVVQGANHSYYSVAWEREVIGHTLAWLESVDGRG